jgi:SAM-dependent methyltransferase
VLSKLRQQILDPDALVRAVASGRRRGTEPPRWRRVELRYVDLKAGRRLQVTAYDEHQAHTSNHAPGDDARDAVDALHGESFGNWHVDTRTESHQVRVTKKGDALLHTAAREARADADRGHDRDKGRLLPEDDPVFVALGLSDHEGRMKPSRQAKYRQVEEFLRILDASVTDAIDKGHLRRPAGEEPLRMADLGCGNGYLTFAAQRYLTHVRGLPVTVIGVDVKQQSTDRNTALATGLGMDAEFVVSGIADVDLDPAPDVVLALHACDTATDDALARGIEWESDLILAAPCCHHDIQRQLAAASAPSPYGLVAKHGLLRERWADVLTDSLRAHLLRRSGYRTDVVEFVDSKHTPRNVLLRAHRTGAPATGEQEAEYHELIKTWSVHPRLDSLLTEVR